MTLSIVLTDLDGTLLSSDGRLGPAARGAVRALGSRGVPLAPLTSKTELELRAWLREIDCGGFGSFENGAGVVAPDGIEVLPEAVPVGELREHLVELRQRLHLHVPTLEELPDSKLTAITGLSPEALSRARARAFDLPFLASDSEAEQLRDALSASPRLRLIAGGNFWHLLGRHDKADAARRILRRLRNGGPSVGLGDAPNDAGFLDVVDVPVLVPGPAGVDARLREAFPRARVAPAPNGEGWAAAVRALLEEETAYGSPGPEAA